MNEPTHGTYDAAKGGWYDSSRRAWVAKSEQLGGVIAAPELEDRHRAEFKRLSQRGKPFAADPQMERLIALRESDKTEERQRFDQLANGTLRMTLHDYEARKAGTGAPGNGS